MKINLSLILILVYFLNCSSNQEYKSNNYKSILTSITKTHRISSNHYSEVVSDKFGNSYIACFKKKKDNQDYIYICKVDEKGNVVWEQGVNYQGRATAITITNRKSILVTGWARNNLKFDNFMIGEHDQNKVFIAEFTFDGVCINMVKNNGDGFFNIERNENGEILVSGISNSQLQLGDLNVKKNNDHISFIAHYDNKLNCNWVKWIDAQVWQIKHLKDNYFLTGGFSDTLVVGNDTLTTTNYLDGDGFISKISDKGDFEWSKNFGQAKIPKAGYKSREIGCDIAFNDENEVIISANLNSEVSNDDNALYFLVYDKYGEFKEQYLIVEQTNNTLSTIQIDDDGDFWVSGNRKSNHFLPEPNQNSQSFVYEFSSKFQLKRKIEPQHQKNMLFRSAYAGNKRQIVFTGHFQHFMSINKDTLRNTGQHELFYLNLNSN